MKKHISYSFLPVLLVAASALANEPTRLTGSFVYGVSNAIYPDGNYYPLGWGWDTSSTGYVDPIFLFDESGTNFSQTDSTVNINLLPGNHTFNLNAGFRGSIFPPPPQVALSLYFNDSIHPQITIIAPFREQATDNFGFSPYEGTGYILGGGLTFIAGNSEWIATNGDTIRVTSYWAAWPDVHPLDWVSEAKPVPDGYNDYRAQVSIEVISVPEPHITVLVPLAGLLRFGSRRR